MLTCSDLLETKRELLEVPLLCRAEREPPEERDDRLQQLCSPANDELVQMLLVVVMAPVDVDAPHSEELPELFEA